MNTHGKHVVVANLRIFERNVSVTPDHLIKNNSRSVFSKQQVILVSVPVVPIRVWTDRVEPWLRDDWHFEGDPDSPADRQLYL